MKFIRNAIITALITAAAPVLANGTLMGRDVVMSVQTYNDPANPLFDGAEHRSKVTEGIEYGLGNEGQQNDVDVVPILIDISANRIEIRYSIAPPSELMTAKFNGYALKFSAGCGEITRGRVDTSFTNLPFDNKRVRVRDGILMLNVAALTTTRESQLAVDLEMTDC